MPSFDGLASIASVKRAPSHTLHAVYYDTPGRDLAAHHITVRRRTGGTDSGWHLKLPARRDARTEIRTALGNGGDDEVPAELRDVVLAIVRDRPMEPVARIVTSRTIDVLYGSDGTALAEFSDDHVTASADGEDTQQRWREWELELAEDAIAMGSADEQLLARLSNRLRDAGATPAEHASKLARVLGSSVSAPRPGPDADDSVHRAVAEQIEALLTWDRGVRADVEDSVHQMRVTIRTIRSLLQASASVFGLTDDAGLLDELRELAAVLGTARDAEVLADRYQRALDELPSDVVRGPIRERLVNGAQQRYRAGWRKSLSAMRSERYFRLLDALDGLVAAEPAALAVDEEQLAEATIKDGYKRVRKRVKAAAAADAEHHDARCTGFARVPSGCATLPQRRTPRRCPAPPKPSRQCLAIIKTASSAAPTLPNRPTPRTLPGKIPSPTVYCMSAKPASHTTASSSSTRR
jgi:CHAD domain-containing protein